ncbi:MAG: hypothetical protein ACK2T7_14505, partial [Anaerolineales bacterium]
RVSFSLFCTQPAARYPFSGAFSCRSGPGREVFTCYQEEIGNLGDNLQAKNHNILGFFILKYQTGLGLIHHGIITQLLYNF